MLTSANGCSASRVKVPLVLGKPMVAKVENISSKVQAWRTEVTEPSGA